MVRREQHDVEREMTVKELNDLTKALTPKFEQIIRPQLDRLRVDLEKKLQEQDRDLERKFTALNVELSEIKKVLHEVRGGRTLRTIIKYVALVLIAIIGLITRGEIKWPIKN